MILLTSSSDLLEVVTGASVSDIYVQASFVDLSSVNVLTPGRQNTIITTATTTTVVPSPAAGTNRALKNLCIFNSSASPCQVSILHTDGTNSVEIFNYTTQTGESIYWSEGRGFYVQDALGNFKTGQTTTAAGSNGDIQYNNNGITAGSAATATAAGTIDLPAGQVLKFSTDTGISRDSAGVLDIGNGTAADISGSVKAAILVLGTSFKLAASSVMTAISGAGTIIASALSSLGTAPSGDVLTADGSGNVKDSGTLLSALATLLSPAFTGTPTAPTQAAFDNSTSISTDAYADNNFKGWQVTGFRDDFLSSTSTLISITATATITGDSGLWNAAIVGAGTQTYGSNVSTFTNPGAFSLQTSAASTGDGIALFRCNSINATDPSFGALGSNANWEINWIVEITSVASVCLRVGLCAASTQTADPPTGGIWIRFDTAASDTFFTAECRSASTSTASVLATSPSASTFYRFRIRSLVAGTILFSVNGGSEVSINTNVPTVVLGPWMQLITRTAAAKTAVIDFCSYMAATGRT